MTKVDLSVQPGQQFDAIVYPAEGPLTGRLLAQPSKNYTTRYVLAASLADNKSVVYNCATSADSEALQSCIRQYGAEVTSDRDPDSSNSVTLHITGVGGNPVLQDDKPINPGNAGAVLRFLLAVVAKMPTVRFITDHLESLGKRPNNDLLQALQQLGVVTESNNGMLPITLNGEGLHGGDVTISGARSSQFLSGLLFLAPLIGEEVRIRVVDGLVSQAPVRQTLEVLRATGIDVSASDDLLSYRIGPSVYKSGDYRVNGDWPGSAALLAAAAVTRGKIQVEDLMDDEQGEKASATFLQAMGATVAYMADGAGIELACCGDLRSVEFDGDLATDAVLALMGAACLAKGTSRIHNVSNLRIKECDRISEPLAELRKIGVKCWEGHEVGDTDPDAIIIEGNPEGYDGGVTVDGRDDHRVIMLLSIVALRCKKPVRILRAHQVSKSYPEYFNHLAALGAHVEFDKIGS